MRSPYFVLPHSKTLSDNTSFGRPTDQTRLSTRAYRAAGKRAFDIVFSAAFLLVAWPAIAIFALLIARDGGNPFFGHWRIGRAGRRFRCLKLRTMVADAEDRLDRMLDANPHLAEEWLESRKLTEDPRITSFGSFLRSTSLDELPQFWNVLRGDMSLVGPRPVTEDELVEYGDHGAVYKSVRPGLSGPWQVGKRNQMPFHARADIDANYARSYSFSTDLAILFKTVSVVLRRTGC